MKINLLRCVSFLVVIPSLFSCASTEIIEGGADHNSDVIALSVSAPQNVATRADASHVLRYTARLLKKDVITNDYTEVQKKQMLEGSTGSTLVFEGVETGTYAINVFADYIPATSQPQEGGTYADCYYDTSHRDDVKMKPFGPEIVNNDHFDCFGTYLTLEKNEDEVRRTVSLPRITAKVRVVSTNLPQEGTTTISIASLPALTNYKLQTTTASSPANYPTAEVNDAAWDITPSNPTEGELFYFYTLTSGNNRIEKLSVLNFTASTTDLEPVTTNVRSGTIEVQQNYITTLKGTYLPTPPEDPATRTDRIILNLTPLPSWN